VHKQLLTQSPLLALPLFALLLFLAVFALWVLRTYARRAEAYAKVAALPLESDTGAPAPAGRAVEETPEVDHAC
jgi:cbb3-type cytochrome oxidase subunit 3